MNNRLLVAVLVACAIGFGLGSFIRIGEDLPSITLGRSDLEPRLSELTLELKELNRRIELIDQQQASISSLIQSRLRPQDLQKLVANAIHGCQIYPYTDSSIATVECPIF